MGVWDGLLHPGPSVPLRFCHKHGAKLAAQLQLCYEWRATGEDELHSYAPSIDVASGPFVGMPEKEFTKEEIQLVVSSMKRWRCQLASIIIKSMQALATWLCASSPVLNMRTEQSRRGDTKRLQATRHHRRRSTSTVRRITRYRSLLCRRPYARRVSVMNLKEVIEVVEAHGIDACGPSRLASMRLLGRVLTSRSRR